VLFGGGHAVKAAFTSHSSPCSLCSFRVASWPTFTWILVLVRVLALAPALVLVLALVVGLTLMWT